MTQYNVELFVLSLDSPGPQSQHDKKKAENCSPFNEPRASPEIDENGVCRALRDEQTTIWQ